MEGALELGGIEWTAATAVSARERLIAVTSDRRRACYPTLTAYEPLWDQRHPELIEGPTSCIAAGTLSEPPRPGKPERLVQAG